MTHTHLTALLATAAVFAVIIATWAIWSAQRGDVRSHNHCVNSGEIVP